MSGALYSEAVRERCREPRRAGAWPDGAAHVGTGSVGSLDAGTWTRLQVHVDAAGRIDDTRFKVFGCSAAIASASFVADALVGTPASAAPLLTAGDVADALQLPDDKRHVAAMATEAAQAAAADWQRRLGAGDWGLGPESGAVPMAAGSGESR